MTEPVANPAPLGRWPESKRPMGIGVMLPLLDGGAFGGQPRFKDILEMAQTVEACGFDGVWMPDHFIFRHAANDRTPQGIWEAFTTIAAVAAQVPRVSIGVLVTCLGWRNPGIVAKMAENIDEISEGRFILGVGAGWHEPEYEMFHLPWDHRFGRFKDSISIINPLLRTGRADYEGEFFSATEALNLPGGPRRAEGGPPILVGTNGPKTMRLAAQFADAWNSDWHHDPSTVLPRLTALDEACAEVGRDPKSIVRTSGSNVALSGYLGRRANPMEGNPEQLAEQIAAFREIGLRHWVAGLDPCNPAKIEEFAKVIEILDRS